MTGFYLFTELDFLLNKYNDIASKMKVKSIYIYHFDPLTIKSIIELQIINYFVYMTFLLCFWYSIKT